MTLQPRFNISSADVKRESAKAKTSSIHVPLQVVGGLAEAHGGILRGDQIVSVNDKDLTGAQQDEAVAALKTLPAGNVKLKLRRFKLVTV